MLILQYFTINLCIYKYINKLTFYNLLLTEGSIKKCLVNF